MDKEPLDDVMERLMVAAVDLGWTPPGWRGADLPGDALSPDAEPSAAWILERVGDIAYALANHVRESEMRRNHTSDNRPQA
jgi:hypothetical protein